MRIHLIKLLGSGHWKSLKHVGWKIIPNIESHPTLDFFWQPQICSHLMSPQGFRRSLQCKRLLVEWSNDPQISLKSTGTWNNLLHKVLLKNFWKLGKNIHSEAKRNNVKATWISKISNRNYVDWLHQQANVKVLVLWDQTEIHVSQRICLVSLSIEKANMSTTTRVD